MSMRDNGRFTPDGAIQTPERRLVAPPTTLQQLTGQDKEETDLGILGKPLHVSSVSTAGSTTYHARLDFPMKSDDLAKFLHTIAPVKSDFDDPLAIYYDWRIMRDRDKGAQKQAGRHVNIEGWDTLVPHRRVLLDVISRHPEDLFMRRIHFSASIPYNGEISKYGRFRGHSPHPWHRFEHPAITQIRETIGKMTNDANTSRNRSENVMISYAHLRPDLRKDILETAISQVPPDVARDYYEKFIAMQGGVILSPGEEISLIPTNGQGQRLKYSKLSESRVAARMGKTWYIEGEVEKKDDKIRFNPDESTLIRDESFVVPHLVWTKDHKGARSIVLDLMFTPNRLRRTGNVTDNTLIGLMMLPYVEPNIRDGWEKDLYIDIEDEEGNTRKIGPQKNRPAQVVLYAIQKLDEITGRTTVPELAEQYLEEYGNVA